MTLEKALAVYAYLQHALRSDREQDAFNTAWRTIADEAEKAISQDEYLRRSARDALAVRQGK